MGIRSMFSNVENTSVITVISMKKNIFYLNIFQAKVYILSIKSSTLLLLFIKQLGSF